jgi:putative addiction module killer protein
VDEIIQTDNFSEWLAALRDRQARTRILERMTRLALGNPGQHRVLTSGLTEMKIDSGPGYRIYYVRRGVVVIVLLCAGDKSTQQKDIAMALELSQQW